MEGAKKRIFGISEGFFDLYTPQKRRKHDTLLDFAAFLRQRKILTQKVPQKVKILILRHRLRHRLWHDFALPKKRRKI